MVIIIQVVQSIWSLGLSSIRMEKELITLKKFLPIELVYFEVFDRIDEAFLREKQVQRWSRKKKEALMNSDFDLLHELAKCQNDSAAEKNK